MVTRPLSLIRPSGVALPLILRKKYNDDLANAHAHAKPPQDGDDGDAAKSATTTAAEATAAVMKTKKLPLHPTTNDSSSSSSRVFTAEELEQNMTQAFSVMTEIQKQLHRGEEVYVDETHAHGNLFRGWDTFIDLRDLTEPSGAGSRRVPADHRWFSTSCATSTTTTTTGSHHHYPHNRPSSRMSTSTSTTPTPRSAAPTPVLPGIESSPTKSSSTTTASTMTNLRIMNPTTTTTTSTRGDDSNAFDMIGPDGSTTPMRRNSSRKRKQGEA